MNGTPTAFPWTHKDITCTGMTLRDYFAAKAMQTILAYRRHQFDTDQTDGGDWDEFFGIIAEESYTISNEMMKAREI